MTSDLAPSLTFAGTFITVGSEQGIWHAWMFASSGRAALPNLALSAITSLVGIPLLCLTLPGMILLPLVTLIPMSVHHKALSCRACQGPCKTEGGFRDLFD